MDTRKYGVPNFITNDGLRDTIVQIEFESEYNQRKIEEVLVTFLQQTQTEIPFQRLPLGKKDPLLRGQQARQEQYVINNGVFKILVKADRILFNNVRTYQGWDKYCSFILSCLSCLEQYVQFTKVSIRYVSEYIDFKISEVLDWEFKFNSLPSSTSNMLEIQYKINVPPQQAIAIAKIIDYAYINNELKSLIDITISSKIEREGLTNVEEILDFCHKYEKDFYFRLLKKEFVDTKLPKN